MVSGMGLGLSGLADTGIWRRVIVAYGSLGKSLIKGLEFHTHAMFTDLKTQVTEG
jgi:hypothetical protein